MKFALTLVTLFLLCRRMVCQDVLGSDANTLSDLLKIVKIMESKLSVLDERTIAIEELLVQTSRSDQITILQKSVLSDIKNQKEIISEVCSKSQAETLRELLASDECADGTHHCSTNAICQDVTIGYNCVCIDGYEGDGFKCEAPYVPCEFPSQEIEGLGCLIPEGVDMGSWDYAQQQCKDMGPNVRLLEGVTSTHLLYEVQQKFSNMFSFAWAGIRNLTWVEGGEGIDPQSPLWFHVFRGEYHPENKECGAVWIGQYRASLMDSPCYVTRPYLCQRYY